MAITLLLLLPVAACLYWLTIHFLLAPRTSTFGLFILLLVAGMGTFFSYSCYDSPFVSWQLLDIAIMLGLLFGPCLIPLIWMYLERMKPGDKYQSSIQLLWIMAPVALFTGALMIHMISWNEHIVNFYEILYTEGHRRAHELYEGSIAWQYHRWVAIAYRVVLILEIIALLAMCITMSRRNNYRTKNLKKFFRGEKIKLRQLQMHVVMLTITVLTIKLGLPRMLMVQHVWIPVLFSILINIIVCIFCYLALFGDKEDITLKEMQLAWRYNYSNKDKVERMNFMVDALLQESEKETLKFVGAQLLQRGIVPEMVKNVSAIVQPNAINTTPTEREDNSLIARFKRLMIDEKLYLRPGLTLQDVAAKLHSNKTYISKLVNSTYNQGFPDLVNCLRVEYAKEYIVKNRSERQEAIAKACGFLSASSFNSIFKKITGTTPKVWLASNDKK